MHSDPRFVHNLKLLFFAAQDFAKAFSTLLELGVPFPEGAPAAA